MQVLQTRLLDIGAEARDAICEMCVGFCFATPAILLSLFNMLPRSDPLP